jgi:hypothetical protein
MPWPDFRKASEYSDEELKKGLASCDKKEKAATRIARPAAWAFVAAVVFAPVFVCAATGATFMTALSWCLIGGGTGLYAARRVKRFLEKKAAIDRTAFTAETEKRASPSFRESLRLAALEVKKIFNAAVDKAFHGGTENKLKVKKPLQLRKPGDARKKPFFQ